MADKSGKGRSKKQDIPQKPGKSGGSGKEDDAKRMRVAPQKQQFMVPGATADSPPRFLALEEIMAAASGLQDMALVHQIVVDDDFKLRPAEYADDSPEKKIKDTMTKAYWDLLRSQLDAKPPDYAMALQLLEDIKQGLFNVLLPQHTKIKQQINEVLDADLIKQQTEKGALDFNHYAQYTIGMMAKLCAPIRDDKIKQLTETKDVVDTFKGILETLQLMALDMANFAIEVAKPDIVKHSVEYERKKFADVLKIQPEPIPLDGLESTKKWLLRHIDTTKDKVNKSDKAAVRNLTTKVLGEAYMDLMHWDNQYGYPETLMLDEAILRMLQARVNEMVYVGAIMLITFSTCATALQNDVSFKNTLKQNLFTLVSSAKSPKDLKENLPSIGESILKQVKTALTQQKLNAMTTDNEKALKAQIKEVCDDTHKIRDLVRQRIREFLQQVITSTTANPQQVPPGLTSLQKELAYIAGKFLKIISHNRAVYSEYYVDIVSSAFK